MGIVIFSLGIAFVIWVVCTCAKDSKDMEDKPKEVLNKFGECKYSLFTDCGREYLVVTKDDKINYSYPKSNLLGEVDIKNILKVDLQFITVNKNKKQPLTIMDTYNTSSVLRKINLKIFQMNDGEDISITYLIANQKSDLPIKLEKFKYLVEDIKNRYSIQQN